MKQLNLKISVCPDCPYYDDLAIDVCEPLWCLKSERELTEDVNVPDWCVLEECYDAS